MTTDMTEKEFEAMIKAGQMGGEYLESIGKTDLSLLSQQEWQTFLKCVCLEYDLIKNSRPDKI